MKLIMKNKISNLCGIILIAFAVGYVMRYFVLYSTSAIQTEYYEIIIFIILLLSFCFVFLLLFYNMTKISKYLLVISLIFFLFEKVFFLSLKVLKVLPLSEIRHNTKYSNNLFLAKDLVYSDWNIKEVGFTNTSLVLTENFAELRLHYSDYCYYVDLSNNLYLVFWRHSNVFQ